jgi:hypothetical protein
MSAMRLHIQLLGQPPQTSRPQPQPHLPRPTTPQLPPQHPQMLRHNNCPPTFKTNNHRARRKQTRRPSPRRQTRQILAGRLSTEHRRSPMGRQVHQPLLRLPQALVLDQFRQEIPMLSSLLQRHPPITENRRKALLLGQFWEAFLEG